MSAVLKHESSPHCWCDPELVAPGLYVHHDMEGVMKRKISKAPAKKIKGQGPKHGEVDAMEEPDG